MWISFKWFLLIITRLVRQQQKSPTHAYILKKAKCALKWNSKGSPSENKQCLETSASSRYDFILVSKFFNAGLMLRTVKLMTATSYISVSLSPVSSISDKSVGLSFSLLPYYFCIQNVDGEKMWACVIIAFTYTLVECGEWQGGPLCRKAHEFLAFLL